MLNSDDKGQYRCCPKCKTRIYSIHKYYLRRADENGYPCSVCKYDKTTRLKMSNSMKGRVISPEHRKKISNSKLGKPSHSKRPYEWAYNNISYVSKHRGIKNELTYEQFLTFTSVNKCHYCGRILNWYKHKKNGQSVAYNLDRKDNISSYSINNCVACCSCCNKIKSNIFTYDEMVKIGKTVNEVFESRLFTH